jgi:hypothetical protein
LSSLIFAENLIPQDIGSLLHGLVLQVVRFYGPVFSSTREPAFDLTGIVFVLSVTGKEWIAGFSSRRAKSARSWHALNFSPLFSLYCQRWLCSVPVASTIRPEFLYCGGRSKCPFTWGVQAVVSSNLTAPAWMSVY